MELMDAICTRRSVRKFESGKQIPQAIVDDLLQAAMQAPSAGAQFPWEFVVLDKRDILDRIPDFHPYAKMVEKAPLAIVVCGDMNKQNHADTWMQDCSAASQNMLLAAHDRGVGGVWVGVWPEMDRVAGLRKLLEMPENIMPLCINVFGYAKATPKPVDRMDAVRIHRNGW